MERVLAQTDKTIVEADGVTPYLPLPEIRLPTLNGESMSTRDLLGQRFVLHVFASW